jgi:phosphopantothenoylcysteine decarboxylase/phosphopantothenate--cysteine ligase
MAARGGARAGKSVPKGKHVLVGVTGSIAAFKAAEIVSQLRQRGVLVTVMMTREAEKLVTVATFQALSGRKALVDLWEDTTRAEHLRLAAEADLIVIAPATANVLGKTAAGLADDVVSATLLAAPPSKVLFCPAMNDRMWASPIVRENVEKLRRHGYSFLGPVEGWLAEGYAASGRMSEIEDVLAAVEARLRAR